MPLLTNKFCGLTVRDFQGSMGLGNQTSQLSIQLVQDHQLGDVPQQPLIGWPAYLTFYNFTFNGIVQKWEKSNSLEGLPTYNCVLIDPREILEGAQVIIGEYNGSVGSVFNLINAYGFWESVGFGSSNVNAGGMKWTQIEYAVNAICNTPTRTSFGGPLNYRGVNYSIDLSQLPKPPAYYRIGGGYASLLDMITQICDDCACEFFVELVGYTIRVRPIFRNAQPPLGTISRLLEATSYSGFTVRADFGLESRNEITSAFLVGGQKTDVHLGQTIFSYWGNDLGGTPIIGVPGVHVGIKQRCEFMRLNATGISDIVGAPYYQSNTFEMRAALHSQESWSSYIKRFKPRLYRVIDGAFRLASPIDADGVQQDVKKARLQSDLVNDDAEFHSKAHENNIVSYTDRMYAFVRTMAEEYYGREFMVMIPSVVSHQDTESLQITTNYEIAQSGFLVGGASAIGIAQENLDTFQESDDRVVPFAYWNDTRALDTQRCDWSGTVMQNNKMWARASVSDVIHNVNLLTNNWSLGFPIYSSTTIPCARVSLSSVLYEENLDQYGNVNYADYVIGGAPTSGAPIDGPSNTNAIKEVNKVPAGGTIGVIGVHPAARYPNLCGVPIKSNTDTYGPWVATGAAGKVKYESDSSLTPWDYGGSFAMNLAGNSRVTSCVSNMQMQESGSIEIVGPPLYSMGDTLQMGGPNLTNIDVKFGTSGVTTSYRFQTYTPRFGLFSKQNAERYKRMAQGGVEFRKQLRKALNKAIVAQKTLGLAYNGNRKNRMALSKKESPHTVLMGECILDGGDIRVGVSTETYEAALFLQNPTEASTYNNKALMSWSGLVRPFTSRWSGSGVDETSYLSRMNRFRTGIFTGSNAGAMANDIMYPFTTGADIDVLFNGTGYTGCHAYRRVIDTGSVKGFGLRGPVWVVGWGYGVEEGQVFPNQSSGTGITGSGAWYPNALRRSDEWKSGPVDMLWDDVRGVWTSHDIITARVPTNQNLSGGGSCECWIGGDQNWKRKINNKFSTAVPSGTNIIAGYALNEHKWYVIAADCV